MNLAPITLTHGERYGRLTVLKQMESGSHKGRYRCGCECGNTHVYFTARALMSGKRTDCGHGNHDAQGEKK